MLKKIPRSALIISILLVTVILDQITKVIARAILLGGKEFTYLSELLVIRHTENTGAFLSLGADLPEAYRFGIFVVIVFIGLGYLLYTVLKTSEMPQHETISMSLIIGGGIGNLIDRMFRGSVTDFLNMGVGPVRTGVFNVADLAVTTGAVVMALVWLLEKVKKDRSV